MLIEEKKYREKIKNWEEEAKKVGKLFCHSCARMDFNNNRLASNWTNYSELTLIGTSEIIDKKTNQMIGTMEDFKCPKGHGVSIEKSFKRDEYGRPYNPEFKKEK